MFRSVKDIVTNSIKKVGENHLKRVHSRMALSSLKEHEDAAVLTKEEKEAIAHIWGQFGYNGKGEWHRLYKTANGFDARYVPNDVYGLKLLPRLNSTHLLEAWDDKAYYPRFFPEIKQPKAIAFRIDNEFYDEHYSSITADDAVRIIIQGYDRIIVKPSDGLEGRGVQLINVLGFDTDSLKEKLVSSGKNYVVQEVVEQHDSLAIYNRSSVNPIRVMTLRMGSKIHYLHSTLRFGMPGAHTDMAFIDGKEIAHVCAVSLGGKVAEIWYNMDGKKDHVSNLGIGAQKTIPNFGAIIDTAMAVHDGLHHFDLIGCDITLDRNEKPILIEYNVYWPGIIIPQYCHGPLFGEYTEELLYRLKNHPTK